MMPFLRSSAIDARKVILAILVTSAVSTGTGQEFYYYQGDSIHLTPVPNRFTLQFSDSVDTDLLDSLGVDYTMLMPDLAEAEANGDSLALWGDEIFSVVPVYLDLDSNLVRMRHELVVRFSTATTLNQKDSLIAACGMTFKSDLSLFEVYYCADPVLHSAGLFESGKVEWAEPNFYLTFSPFGHIPNDELFNRQWNLLQKENFTIHNDSLEVENGIDLNVSEAWLLTTGDPHIQFAVIDRDAFFGSADFPSSRYTGSAESGSIESAHGTACAGIIGAEMDNDIGIAGIASKCKMRYITANSGSAEYGYNIFINCYTLGVRVFSMSMGIDVSNFQAVEDAVEQCLDMNSLFCQAAGTGSDHNLGFNSSLLTGPHHLPNYITVGASDHLDNSSDYSTWNCEVDIVAPSAADVSRCTYSWSGNPDAYLNYSDVGSSNIWTLDAAGNNGYNPWPFDCDDLNTIPQPNESLPESLNLDDHLNYTGRFYGTSAATPQVAGVVALMISANSCLTTEQAYAIITETAVSIPDESADCGNLNMDCGETSCKFGHGRVNAYEAVKEALIVGGFEFEIKVIDCPSEGAGIIELDIVPGEGYALEDYSAEWITGYGSITATSNTVPTLAISELDQPQTVPYAGWTEGFPFLIRIIRTDPLTQEVCTSTRQFWLDGPFLQPADIVNAFCPADLSGGAFSLTASNPNPADNVFAWELDEIGQDEVGALFERDSLQGDQYVIKVTNSQGKSCYQSIDVLTESDIALSAATFDATCTGSWDGAIDLTVTGGIEDYTFEWFDGETLVSTDEDPNGLQAGAYAVVVTDMNGCIGEDEVQVGVETGVTTYGTQTIDFDEVNIAMAIQNAQTVIFTGDLRFSNGTGAFTGVDFYFDSGYGIIIEEGADVTFTDCTFQSCGDNWRGFDVKADRTTTGTGNESGKLTLIGCEVYYAQTGIYTADAAGFNTTSWLMYEGGDIFCNATKFINCGTSFICQYANQMQLPGKLVPKTAFVKCIFRATDDYALHFANGFGSLSRHYTSFGYAYAGCTFENTMTQVAEWQDRGRGIYSFNSVFDFKRYEPINNNPANYVRGKMEGFDAAIDAYGGKKRAITVRWSDFEQNRVGVRLTNTDFFRVYGNKFKVGKATGVAALDGQTTIDTGLEVTDIWYEAVANMGGRHFVLAENTAEGIPLSAGGISNDKLRIGFRVRDTQTPDDEVRLNDFSGLDYAVMADGLNAYVQGLSGLRVVCNDFSYNGFDIRVHEFLSQMEVSVGNQQMDSGMEASIELNYAADNHFTQQLATLDTSGRLYNSGFEINYYFNGSNTAKDPCYNSNESNCSDLISNESVVLFGGELLPNPCLQEFPTQIAHSPAKVAGLVGIADDADEGFEEAEIAFHALTDGGDSQALVYAIENAYGWEVLELRDEMLEDSPYLSSQTLTTIASNTANFPHSVAAEIFAANPQCLHDWRFMRYLITKTDPMPDYLMEALEAIADTSSATNLLLSQMNRARTLSVKHYNRALWAMADTSLYELSDFDDITDAIHLYRHTYPAVDGLLDDGDEGGAENYFEASDTLYYVHISEQSEREVYERWLNLREDLVGANRGWDSLTTAERDTLLSIADNFRTWPGRAALEVLNFFHDSTFVIPPALDTLAWTPRRARVPLHSDSDLRVIPFPNPANLRLFFMFTDDPEPGEILQLSITDGTGRMMLNKQITCNGGPIQIDVSRWVEGAYFFQLEMNGKGGYHGKFVVQR